MRKKKSIFKKYINGTKGVISLFLAILMVPFVSIAAALVNTGRINSAVAIFDEALCNASNSTLGTYDEFIRERFGLMAISQDVSGGGTQFGNTSANYTADDLINDLFAKYMEENLRSMGNTYTDADYEALGLYPLSDNSVLKMSVRQASKVAVPVKLVMDWGSIDDLLSNLTKPFSLLSSIEGLLTSGASAVSSVDTLTTKTDDFETKLTECNTAKEAYVTAYNDFVTAARNYNTTITNIGTAQRDVDTWQSTVDAMNAQVSDLNSQIEAKENRITTLQSDRQTDHTDEIQTLQDEIADLKEQREERVPGYDDAVQSLEQAQSTLANYERQLPGKRTVLRTAKDTYYNKTVALRNKVEQTGNAAIAFQQAGQDVVNAGVTVVTSAVSTGLEIGKASLNKQKEDIQKENEYYRYQETLAGYADDHDAETYYHNLLQENESATRNLDNTNLQNSNISALQREAGDAVKNCGSELTGFATRDLREEYQAVYNGLDQLKDDITAKTIPQDQTKITAYESLYFEVTNPVEVAELQSIVENLEEQIVDNAGWAILKAIVGFIKAMLTIEFNYSRDLQVNIDTSLYSSIGGLPSQNRTPYVAPYATEDANRSNEYKELLNSYSEVNPYEMNNDAATAIQTMMTHIENIQELIDPIKLRNLPELWDEAEGLVSCMWGMDLSSIIQTSWDMMIDHALLVGYVSYNTANRVTYQGKGLTGASYDLPTAAEAQRYAFCGAETEYILEGDMSEKENQKAAFTAVWITRLIFNIAPVLADATIQTIATTIGSVTFGIGTVLTYIVGIVAEALVDSVILANGGDLPIVKSYIYLSPVGVPKLLEKVFSLNLGDAIQQTVYEECGTFANNFNSKIQNAALEHGKYAGEETITLARYDDYKNEMDEIENKPSNIFTIDYTKSLQIIMLLTCTTNKLLKRLADIIEMEANYKANSDISTYTFDLRKSYTYVRASGSFNSNVFMKISETESHTSNNRVIYNGY